MAASRNRERNRKEFFGGVRKSESATDMANPAQGLSQNSSKEIAAVAQDTLLPRSTAVQGPALDANKQQQAPLSAWKRRKSPGPIIGPHAPDEDVVASEAEYQASQAEEFPPLAGAASRKEPRLPKKAKMLLNPEAPSFPAPSAQISIEIQPPAPRQTPSLSKAERKKGKAKATPQMPFEQVELPAESEDASDDSVLVTHAERAEIARLKRIKVKPATTKTAKGNSGFGTRSSLRKRRNIPTFPADEASEEEIMRATQGAAPSPAPDHLSDQDHPSSGDEDALKTFSSTLKRSKLPPPDYQPAIQEKKEEVFTRLFVKHGIVQSPDPGVIFSYSLFAALSANLKHILRTDPSAFGFTRHVLGICTRQKAALAIMCNHDNLRQLLCNALLDVLADEHMQVLGDRTPREFVNETYVNGSEEFIDKDWVCAADVFPVQHRQKILSFEHYTRAMRSNGAPGDLLIFAAFLRIFNLRGMILSHDFHRQEELEEFPEDIDEFLHFDSDFCPHMPSAGDGIYRARTASSRIPIILVRHQLVFDWAHAQSDVWNEAPPASAMQTAVRGGNIPEVLNPNKLQVRPNVVTIATSLDPETMRPPPFKIIEEAADEIRRREEVLAHLMEEETLTRQEAEKFIDIYQANGMKANMASLSKLKRIAKAARENLDPLAARAAFPSTEDIGNVQGKWARHNEAKRRAWFREPRDNNDPPSVQTFDQTHAVAWNMELDAAATCLASICGIAEQAAEAILKAHIASLTATKPADASTIHLALKAAHSAHQDRIKMLQQPEATPPPASNAIAPPSIHQSQIVADSAGSFIETHLGAGVRAMTTQEIITATRDQRRSAWQNSAPTSTPPHLSRFWRIYQKVAADYPRSGMNQRLHNQRLKDTATRELHSEACAAAAAARGVNSALYPAEIPQAPAPARALFQAPPAPFQAPAPLQAPAPFQAPAPAPAPFQAPAPAQHQEVTAPAPARVNAVASTCTHCTHHHAPPQHCNRIPSMMTRSLAQQFISPAHQIIHQHPLEPPTLNPTRLEYDFPITPLNIQSQHAPPTAFTAQHLFSTNTPAAAPSSHYATHASPRVRMAASRTELQQQARSQGNTVVVVSANQQKLMWWKAGEEKDGKGFFWSVMQAVQQTWEQLNASDEAQSYRSFRSAIHFSMIPIICAELLITRQQFDAMPDAQLIDQIEQKLKPSCPADYLIKLRQIRFSKDPAQDLLHRYRAFAEPFIQLITEAREAGCPMNERSIELAFRSQCKDNELLMMWLQEERWSDTATSHQRIVKHLRSYDALRTLDSLNSQGTPQHPPRLEQTLSQAPIAAHMPPVGHDAAPAPPRAPQFAHHQHQNTNDGGRAAPHRFQHQHHKGGHGIMANVMDQLLTRFEALEQHSATPSMHSNYAQTSAQDLHYLQPSANNAGALAASPAAQQPAGAQKEHPGLDHRGPNWHQYGAALQCRFNPCSIVFCQGCGRHGHHSSECSRAHLPRWNHHGYFSDKYAGEGALYQTPNHGRPPFNAPRYPSSSVPVQPGASRFQGTAQMAANSTGPAEQTHRVSFAPPPPFPTPFSLSSPSHNARGGGAARPPGSYTPVARANTAHSNSSPANQAASSPRSADGNQ